MKWREFLKKLGLKKKNEFDAVDLKIFSPDMRPQNTKVLLNGKEFPLIQSIKFEASIDSVNKVTIVFVPESVDIESKAKVEREA